MTDPITHVVAAVIRDERGRILLGQRKPGRDLVGLWEFPGGKREPGESSLHALARELMEELGIALQTASALIEVPHAYPHKRIALEVFTAQRWTGSPVGREGQTLAWVEPDGLGNYPMPAADRPVVAAVCQPDRYLITPPELDDARGLDAGIARAAANGIRRLQLRLRGVAVDTAESLTRAAAMRCHALGIELLLNSAMSNALSLAAELGCGLHLTEGHLLASSTRPAQIKGPLAASCHDARALAAAEALACDFVVLGPIAATATHPDATPLGWSGFRALREQASLPIYALGGMTLDDIRIARCHGAQGIAAIRGLWPT